MKDKKDDRRTHEKTGVSRRAALSLIGAAGVAGATGVAGRTTSALAAPSVAKLALKVPLVIPDLVDYANTLQADDWKPFRPGVTAHWFYNEGDGGASAVLLRYEPGARVPEHEHVGYEHMLVLKGDEYDENGSYPAGSFVINPPGTKHSPGSVGGCIALLIYEKAVRFLAD